MISISDVEKTIRYLKKNGAADTCYAALERLEQRRHSGYTYLPPTDAEVKAQKAANGENKPFITVVMPAYNTPETFLREAVESVIGQTCTNWELVIADASDTDAVNRIVHGYDCCRDDAETSEDDRNAGRGTIRYVRLHENLGISENTNAAVRKAEGDYICFMDHDDLLAPDALFRMTEAMESGAELIYSDEDKLDSDSGIYTDVYRKYDFNFDLLLTNNYICHLTAVRRDIAMKVLLRGEYDGAQDFDMVLGVVRLLLSDGVKVSELGEHICHVPRVLYHWRIHEASTAANTASKSYAYEAGLRAVSSCIDCIYPGCGAMVYHSRHLGFYDICWGNGVNAVFAARPEVGAVMHRVLDRRGKLLPCLMDKDGNMLYAGMNRHFSGDKNLFDCAQDVYAADIRFMFLRPELRAELKRFMSEKGYSGIADPGIKDFKQLSMEFGARLHELGFVILYTGADRDHISEEKK